GSSESIPITISGSRLGKVSTVRVNGDDRKPDKVTEKEITFTLKPEDMTTVQPITIEAVNPDGGVSPAATLHVSDLEISRNPDATPLKDAKDGEAYSEQITATGGAGSSKWALVDAPKWLSIDNTGGLKGTPGPGDVKDLNKVTVKVVDSAGASASKTFSLKVTAKA
ncbi:MAG TPA: putative Ig domain-containing protein, partial [Pyrinomonadaceae bacterium]|nr:putative Ig domain-containing protein [Pyrinomonadaceae bacterium]